MIRRIGVMLFAVCLGGALYAERGRYNHFNRAAAHFHGKDYARCRLELERALYVNDTDREALRNMQLLLEEKLDVPDVDRASYNGGDVVRYYIPRNTLGILVIAVMQLLTGLVLWKIWRRAAGPVITWAIAVSTVVLISLTAVWIWKTTTERFERYAVVISREAVMRLGPARSRETAARPAWGERLRIEAYVTGNNQEKWLRVRTLPGRRGYIRRHSAEPIAPRPR